MECKRCKNDYPEHDFVKLKKYDTKSGVVAEYPNGVSKYCTECRNHIASAGHRAVKAKYSKRDDEADKPRVFYDCLPANFDWRRQYQYFLHELWAQAKAEDGDRAFERFMIKTESGDIFPRSNKTIEIELTLGLRDVQLIKTAESAIPH